MPQPRDWPLAVQTSSISSLLCSKFIISTVSFFLLQFAILKRFGQQLMMHFALCKTLYYHVSFVCYKTLVLSIGSVLDGSIFSSTTFFTMYIVYIWANICSFFNGNIYACISIENIKWNIKRSSYNALYIILFIFMFYINIYYFVSFFFLFIWIPLNNFIISLY